MDQEKDVFHRGIDHVDEEEVASTKSRSPGRKDWNYTRKIKKYQREGSDDDEKDQIESDDATWKE